MEMSEAVVALSALAQDTRLAVFRALVEAGPAGLRPGEIASELALPNATLSFHLGQLRRAGLISAQRDGRMIVYSADYVRMNDLIDFLTANCCGGEISCVEPAEVPRQAVRRAS
jgi:ArsR family transcriptional regulator, arsenate/arsenite/antimonite-responsive transcriptional repressor